jgi:hypothetical protein
MMEVDKVGRFAWLDEGDDIEISAVVLSVRNGFVKLRIGDKEIILDIETFMEVYIGD